MRSKSVVLDGRWRFLMSRISIFRCQRARIEGWGSSAAAMVVGSRFVDRGAC